MGIAAGLAFEFFHVFLFTRPNARAPRNLDCSGFSENWDFLPGGVERGLMMETRDLRLRQWGKKCSEWKWNFLCGL